MTATRNHMGFGSLCRRVRAAVVGLNLVVALAPDAAQAQTLGTEVRPKAGAAGAGSAAPAATAPAAVPSPVPPAAPPTTAPAAARAPNTTVIMKTPGAGVGQTDKGRGTAVALQATLIEGGARIEQGLIWRIYDAKQVDGKHRLITTLKDIAPTIRLAPGAYLINAAFGRANLTRQVTVKPADQQPETFVLNAGGLKVSAVLASGEPAPERSTFFDIFGDERDQFGNRTKVLGGVRAGLIVRLNAGIYHIVSTYGDANAIEHADVTVEAGKLTEASVRHAAARVTMKLVTQQGGEAQSDTRWSVLAQDGQVVKESLGALPTHILQAGTYTAVAKQGTASFSQAFTVAPGEVRQIEVVIK